MAGLRLRLWYMGHWGRWHRLATRPRSTLRFLLRSPESGNFTYPIANAHELPPFLAEALGRPAEELAGYLRELDEDTELHAWMGRRPRRGEPRRALFGRRAGWYVAVRALRPRAIVETGTDVGMGTALLARALQRNERDGAPPGRVWTFDLDPRAGSAIPAPLRAWVTHVHGDSHATLPATLPALPPVGVFLHDSDHSAGHERAEFEAVLPFLAQDGVLLTDNGHETTVLADMAGERGLRYRFWHEEPVDHPDPGAGIGIAAPAPAAGVRKPAVALRR